MAFRYFPTKSLTWLVAKYDELTDSAVAGQTITSASAGDVSTSFKTEGSSWSTLAMLYHDMNILDPVLYPANGMADRTRLVMDNARR